MTTSTAPPRRRGPLRRALLPVGLGLVTALLLGASVAVRVDGPVTSAADVDRISEATEQGCERSGAGLDEQTGFAFDGTVLSAPGSAAQGLRPVSLQVDEWFRGPPLDVTEVYLDRATLNRLQADGVAVEPGTRLLVSGRGWGRGWDAPAAAGCGRTRAWDAATAEAWRQRIATTAAVAPDGPLARYPAAGYTRTGADGRPTLVGVLVVDDGCVYVDDGLNRWVPLFPDTSSRWTDRPAQVVAGERALAAGHPVRLPGAPASGLVLGGPRTIAADEAGSVWVDERGVPAGCAPDAPRFVVGDPAEAPGVGASVLPGDDPLLRAVAEAAAEAGLGPGEATGALTSDGFGTQSVQVRLPTAAAGEMVVTVETVSFLAWPYAYSPSAEALTWSANPAQRAALPVPPEGTELAVVERPDGVTQLLLKTPMRAVVSVETDLQAVAGTPLPPGTALRAMRDVAAAVALRLSGTSG